MHQVVRAIRQLFQKALGEHQLGVEYIALVDEDGDGGQDASYEFLMAIAVDNFHSCKLFVLISDGLGVSHALLVNRARQRDPALNHGQGEEDEMTPAKHDKRGRDFRRAI